LTMPAILSEKSCKHTVTSYSRKPGRPPLRSRSSKKPIFKGAPSADAFIEPDAEREVEVEEVEEEEPEMTTREILLAISKLRKAWLSWGDHCVRTTKMLVLAQDEM
jgi:hypothetical protein